MEEGCVAASWTVGRVTLVVKRPGPGGRDVYSADMTSLHGGHVFSISNGLFLKGI